MTPEEQQQVNAMRNFYERQCANLATEGANMAIALESCAQQLKAVSEERDALKKKYEPDNVVPLKEPA